MDFVTVSREKSASFRCEIGAEGLTIGRSSGNDLVLEDSGVSRSHARITRRPEGIFIEDAGGKNGTFVNDFQISAPVLLRQGDRIRIQLTTLTFNGVPGVPDVAFVDSPLPGGGATVVVSRESITPSGNSLFSAETDPTTGARVRTLSGPTSGSFAAGSALNIIFEADKELVFHRPLPEILESVLDLVAKAVPFDRGTLMLLEEGRPVPKVVRVPPGEERKAIEISQTIADRVIHKEESVLTADAQIDDRFRDGRSIVAQQIRSAMCVPLWNNEKVIGLIYIDSRRRAGLFQQEHLRLLTHLANVAAVKIENAMLFEQRVQADLLEEDHKKAWEIQKLLLPAGSPPIPGYQLRGTSDPCRVLGGDLFDFIELPGGRCVIALGDVAGKGYPAALLMCIFQAALRALCDLDLPPKETIERLNKILCRRFPDNRFVTFFYGILDPATHRLIYVNAGHCPPWLIGRNEETRKLESTGAALGFFETNQYRAGEIDIRPGEVFVCYSDGVTEACNSEDEEFGEGKLVAVVKRLVETGPEEIMEQITTEVAAHRNGMVQHDDVTLVVLKRAAA